MKKTIIALVIVVALAIMFVVAKYNHIVQLDESVKTSWSQVENVYQRRMDLIPNLINTVKGAAAQESGVLVAVVNARANASKVNVNINDPESLAAFQQAQGEVSSSLSRLLVTVEKYPELSSIQAFRDLMTQLEGTENRITVERKTFNETVKKLNTYIRQFPANIVANLFGFEQAQQFEAEEWADIAPTVDFNATDTIPTEATEVVTE